MTDPTLTPRPPGDATLLFSGYLALSFAEFHGISRLCKHADPVEGRRDDLTLAEAREIAAIDPGLIYLEVEVKPEVRASPAKPVAEPVVHRGYNAHSPLRMYTACQTPDAAYTCVDDWPRVTCPACLAHRPSAP